MAPRQIPVILAFHPDTNTLTAEPSEITLLGPEDWVSWNFDPDQPGNLPPAHSSLFIHFDKPLGPFQAVRNTTSISVVAKGNSSETRTFNYFPFLVLEDQTTIIEGVAHTIVNQCAVVNTSPRAVVTFVPATPDTVVQLNVQPPSLLLHHGDVALWQVGGGLPDNFILAFQFTGPDADGPFLDFFLGQREAGTQRAGGGTFFHEAANPDITYHVTVWDENGNLVISHDPSIDGLGRPPGT
ncbi:MAG TPA: hypothetical protein VH988_19935 [Thermoanaerobaculia bacterium]|jgi:hypothetical protein|nr:hypothetical protein [Thermoanaerobaculia bacterium]